MISTLIDDSFYLALHAAARCSPSDRNLYWKFLILIFHTINTNSKADNNPYVSLIPPQSLLFLLLGGQRASLWGHLMSFLFFGVCELCLCFFLWPNMNLSNMIPFSVFFVQLFPIWWKWLAQGTIKIYLWLAKRKSANRLSTFFFNLLSLIVLPCWQAGKHGSSFFGWVDHQTMSKLTKVIRHPYIPSYHLCHGSMQRKESVNFEAVMEEAGTQLLCKYSRLTLR